jgi:hypothetical protein
VKPKIWGKTERESTVTARSRLRYKVCQECGGEFETVKGLHSHIRSVHNASAWAYYHFHPGALRARIRASVFRKNGCWNFIGRPKTQKGYRTMRVSGAPTSSAHRLSYFAFKGELPSPSVVVLHACDNARCCNPKHLSLGSHQDNMDERSARGRTARNFSLSDVQALEARRKSKSGWCADRIADYFDVSSDTIKRLLTRETYQHVSFD